MQKVLMAHDDAVPGKRVTHGGSNRHWPATAGALFAVAWLIAAWKPLFPQDWALENMLSLLAAWWLVRRHRRAPLSDVSYLLLLIFGVAHEIGSHYTYAEVPYRDWLASVMGLVDAQPAANGRNHYDRLIHFLFGLLCYRPLREVVSARLHRGSPEARLFPVTVVATISLIYELVEWGAAVVFGGDLGQAYLGTQGDDWDSQKDSGLAVGGAVLACLVASGRTGVASASGPIAQRTPQKTDQDQ